MVPCQICGNLIEVSALRCPYCLSEQEKEEGFPSARPRFSQKTVNLEQGLPTVEQALSRLKAELESAAHEQIRILTLIHGYGSTGKGGAIRVECRKTLNYLVSTGAVHSIYLGEMFNRRNGEIKHLLSRFPDLNQHPHLNRNNKGITLVQLF